MKTLFITAFHSFISHSILNTDAFKTLAKNPDIKIIIFVPEFKKDFYVQAYGGNRVVVEGIDTERLSSSRLPYRFQKLAEMFLSTYTKKMWAAGGITNNRRRAKNHIFYWFELLTFFIAEHIKVSHKVFRTLDFYFSSGNIFGGYIKKYQPELCFATDLISNADTMFLMAAKKQHVKTVGMIRSWDCPTNKSFTRILPDKILALNKQVKNEMAIYHDADPEKIFLVGFPQFDPYISEKPDSREEFFKNIGADLNKRLIIFAPAGSFLSSDDGETAAMLQKALNDGRIPKDTQFLVRNHPQNPADLSGLENDPNFIIDKPGISFGSNAKANELDKESVQHLLDSLYYSDLVITVNTSLVLDGIVFDKPQIMIAFDGNRQKPYLESVRRYHDENNVKGFIETGAARVVKNPGELILWINKYLKNPKTDAEYRKKARNEIIMNSDGKSGERIANFILEFIKRINDYE